MKIYKLFLLCCIYACSKESTTKSDFKQADLTLTIKIDYVGGVTPKGMPDSNVTKLPNVQYSTVKIDNKKLIFTDETNCNLKADALTSTFKDFTILKLEILNEITKSCK